MRTTRNMTVRRWAVLAAFAVALLSLVSDIIYAYLDPRVRYR